MTQLYANRLCYTDVEPCEVVEVRTANKMVIREMAATLDPAWKREFYPGGFFGHTANDRSQRWLITPDLTAKTFAIRKHKDGRWYDAGGSRYAIAGTPYKFYDHNF